MFKIIIGFDNCQATARQIVSPLTQVNNTIIIIIMLVCLNICNTFRPSPLQQYRGTAIHIRINSHSQTDMTDRVPSLLFRPEPTPPT